MKPIAVFIIVALLLNATVSTLAQAATLLQGIRVMRLATALLLFVAEALETERLSPTTALSP